MSPRADMLVTKPVSHRLEVNSKPRSKYSNAEKISERNFIIVSILISRYWTKLSRIPTRGVSDKEPVHHLYPCGIDPHRRCKCRGSKEKG